VSAQITVVRSADIRGARIPLEVLVDGTAVGSLRRGKTLVHEVADGAHTVQAVWKSDRKSPRRTVTAQDGDAETLYLGFVSERAAYLRSPTREADWLVLSTDPAALALHTPQETRVRMVLTAVSLLAYVLNLIAPAGSTLKLVTYVVWIVGILVVGVMLVRHFGQLYRSPHQDKAD